ncbi:MAG: ABC transporter permease [Thermoleophilia bacterium]|nr:ABC transporter permease [Thermoleophilia bacterium]
MTGPEIVIGLAGVLTTASPIVVATIGETFAERAGVINLSVNGTILLSAMGSFAVAVSTGSMLLAFLAGALIGAFVALIVAFGSITLRQSQVAIGFVLTLFCRDLAYFLGNPFMGERGLILGVRPIPLLQDIPILGTMFFKQDAMTYFSFMLIFVAWWWIFRTRPGLTLRAVGERPEAAFARGARVDLIRYVYTTLGGALVGLAGPMFSLGVKAGWKGTISGLDGLGWIVLAIVIFGAWNPIRAALGAYLFGLLQWLSVVLQPSLQGIPSQVLQVAPFPVMILTLLLVNVGNAEWVERVLAALPEPSRKVAARVIRALRVVQPRSLGVPFERD